MPVAVGMSLVPVAAAAQQVPVIRVGQTLTGVFDGSEPTFDNQYLLRGHELTLRRGETVTVSLSSRDVIAIPLVIGDKNSNALPEDGSPETVTFTISVRSGRQAAAAPPPPPPPPTRTTRPPPPPPPVRPAPPPPPPASRPAQPTVRGQSTSTIDIAGAWTGADQQLDNGNRVDLYEFRLRRGDRVRVQTEAGVQ